VQSETLSHVLADGTVYCVTECSIYRQTWSGCESGLYGSSVKTLCSASTLSHTHSIQVLISPHSWLSEETQPVSLRQFGLASSAAQRLQCDDGTWQTQAQSAFKQTVVNTCYGKE